MAPVDVKVSISTATAATPPASIAEAPKHQEVTVKVAVGKTTVSLSIGNNVKVELHIYDDEAVAAVDDRGTAPVDNALCEQAGVHSNAPLEGQESLSCYVYSGTEDGRSVGSDSSADMSFLATIPKDMLALENMTGYAAQHGRTRDWNKVQYDVLDAGEWASIIERDIDEANDEQLYAVSPTLVAQDEEEMFFDSAVPHYVRGL